MTDASGTVVWAADYKPFGEVNITINTITNNLGFPGHYRDAETGLIYNMNRNYNKDLGRYVEADPVGIKYGANHLYLYARGNPVIWFDESGLTPAEVLYCLLHPVNCSKAWDCRDKAFQATVNRFGYQGRNDASDAFRHCYVSCCMAQKIGADAARKIGDAHEEDAKNPHCEKEMDLNNNATGRWLGASKPNGDCGTLCGSAPLQQQPSGSCKQCGTRGYYPY